MENKLKPCKCGCQYHITVQRDMITGLFFAICLECKESTRLCKSEQQAIDAWNRREK